MSEGMLEEKLNKGGQIFFCSLNNKFSGQSLNPILEAIIDQQIFEG